MPVNPPLIDRLRNNPVYLDFIGHPFFATAKDKPLDKSQVVVFIGQWWHPLHYFPTFLARSVSVFPDIGSKSAITRILNQEVGGGRPDRAHEVIYIDSMAKAGFDRAGVTGSAPFPETTDLVRGYEKSSAEHLLALGSVFATEVTDLLMVSSIGAAVRRATGVENVEWVDIHVTQEPDHVDEANQSLTQDFGPVEEATILGGAEDMWRLWHGFFDRLATEIGVAAA